MPPKKVQTKSPSDNDGQEERATKEAPPPPPKTTPSMVYADRLLSCLSLLHSGVTTLESKHTGKALRHLSHLRTTLRPRALRAFLDRILLDPSQLKPAVPPKPADGEKTGKDNGGKEATSKDTASSGKGTSSSSPFGAGGYVGHGRVGGAGARSIGIDLVRQAYDALERFLIEEEVEEPPKAESSGGEDATKLSEDAMVVEGSEKEKNATPPPPPAVSPTSPSSSSDSSSSSTSSDSPTSSSTSSTSSPSSSSTTSTVRSGWQLTVSRSGNASQFDVLIPEHRFMTCIPEVETFLVLLVVLALVDKKLYKEAMAISDVFTQRVKGVNRRTLDALGARAYFYKSLSYERGGELKDIRAELMGVLRSSTLHHDHMTSATVLNLLLRNYLHYHLYDLARKLISKAVYPDTLRSNAQFARFLYYLGRIHAVQLEYSQAHAKLLQAGRKAPGNVGKGFRLQATKMAVVVELLMGEIPDRQTFNQKDIRSDLLPYQQIVQAVRCGELSLFHEIMDKYKDTFERDGTLFLIRRLHHNVILAGLRMINISYCNITLSGVATKLGLESAADAEAIVSKSIYEKVIEATIEHDTSVVTSKPHVDVYSSGEPIKALHKRIAFCLQLHSDAVRAMQYPETDENKADEAEARRLRHLEEIARAEVEDMNGDDMDLL